MKVGDTVRFLDSIGGGIVRRIDEARQLAYVEDPDGFEIPTTFAQCVVVESANNPDKYRQNISAFSKGPSSFQMQTKQQADKAKPEMKANGHKEPKLPEQIEVDLHIDKLLPAGNSVPQQEMLAYQLRTFRRVMQEQKLHRGRRIVFIHGKGEGVLRREIANILRKEYPSCFFQDASYQKYSSGATLVLIN